MVVSTDNECGPAEPPGPRGCCVLVQVIRWLPGIRRIMAERTGQGTAWYAGTYTRSQNHSEPWGRGGGASP